MRETEVSCKIGSGINLPSGIVDVIRGEIMKVVAVMIPEFRRVHKSLCEKVGLAEKPEWVEEIISKVL